MKTYYSERLTVSCFGLVYSYQWFVNKSWEQSTNFRFLFFLKLRCMIYTKIRYSYLKCVITEFLMLDGFKRGSSRSEVGFFKYWYCTIV